MVLVSDIKLIIRSDTTAGFHIALVQSLLRAYKIIRQSSNIERNKLHLPSLATESISSA